MEASDFEVTLSDGTTAFKLSDQRGKAVLINLWATWCPPCVAEMPDLQKLSEDYAGSLVVRGINIGDNPEKATAYMEDNGYTYPLYVDYDHSLSLAMFPSPFIPFTVIIDPNGVVTAIHSGLGNTRSRVRAMWMKPWPTPRRRKPRRRREPSRAPRKARVYRRTCKKQGSPAG